VIPALILGDILFLCSPPQGAV